MNKNKAQKRKAFTSDSSSFESISLSTSTKDNGVRNKKSVNEISSETGDYSFPDEKRKNGKRFRSCSYCDLALSNFKPDKRRSIYKGLAVDYNEPPEAKKPKKKWRLYPVNHSDSHRTYGKSVYLIGRLRKLVDIPVNHPTCSKQHAALQYRLMNVKKSDGTFGKSVRPYLMDLNSVNGTFVNNKKIEPNKYTELREKDIIKFGDSSVEYVLLHKCNRNENEEDAALEDDNLSVKQEFVN